MKAELINHFDNMSREELTEAIRLLEKRIAVLNEADAINSLGAAVPPHRESLYRLLTESSRDMISRHAPDGRILYVSPAVKRILGYEPDETVGKYSKDFLRTSDYELISNAIDAAWNEGKDEFSVEHKMVCKDGTDIWTETCGVFFLGASNEIVEIHCSVRNIDDRKKTEEQLVSVMDAIENMSVPVFWLNQEGRFLYVNKSACASLGYTVEEFQSLTIENIDPCFTVERWKTEWSNLKTIRHVSFESKHRTKDGRIFPVEIMADYTNVNGNEIHWSFVRDISPQRNTEEAMEQMEQRLRQAEKMEAIGLLAGGIAHDFNNQLAGLMGYADLLRDELSDLGHIEYVDGIILGINRAAGLTEQLLAFSRRGKYFTLPVNINVIIKEVGSILRHSIDKKIVIRNRLCSGPPIVMGDPSQLQNAILNLAINARDAMPDGGTLTFYTERLTLNQEFCDEQPYNIVPGNYIRISVIDTGIGMTQETLKHAFEPFYTTKEHGKGTGMGLAAVYGTIKNHKGSVDLFSQPGKGTEVRIHLPASDQEFSYESVNQERSTDSVTFDICVLLVEDEPSLAEVETAMLRSLGCTVILCKNGKEAVDTFSKSWRDIDLVILDMVMPVMNGKEAFYAMKKINPDVLAILVSGYSLNGEAQSLLAKGIKGFVHKPYQKSEMADAIAEAIRTN